MAYTPIEILDYVIDNGKEAEFLVANSMHKQGYSISEIPDIKYVWNDTRLRIFSKSYNINEIITDPEIMIASKSGKYISTFISRYHDDYQVHFLVHDCMEADKAANEEEITMRVIQYMILKTIKQLRLDAPYKVDDYLKF